MVGLQLSWRGTLGFGSSCWKINEQITKNACTQVTKVQCNSFFYNITIFISVVRQEFILPKLI